MNGWAREMPRLPHLLISLRGHAARTPSGLRRVLTSWASADPAGPTNCGRLRHRREHAQARGRADLLARGRADAAKDKGNPDSSRCGGPRSAAIATISTPSRSPDRRVRRARLLPGFGYGGRAAHARIPRWPAPAAIEECETNLAASDAGPAEAARLHPHQRQAVSGALVSAHSLKRNSAHATTSTSRLIYEAIMTSSPPEGRRFSAMAKSGCGTTRTCNPSPRCASCRRS